MSNRFMVKRGGWLNYDLYRVKTYVAVFDAKHGMHGHKGLVASI